MSLRSNNQIFKLSLKAESIEPTKGFTKDHNHFRDILSWLIEEVLGNITTDDNYRNEYDSFFSENVSIPQERGDSSFDLCDSVVLYNAGLNLITRIMQAMLEYDIRRFNITNLKYDGANCYVMDVEPL